MKRTELEKLKAKKVESHMRHGAPAHRFAQGSAEVPDRREQRRLDRERGLVPFAVKLDGALVQQLHTLAGERSASINDLVAELLTKGIEAGAG